MRIYRNLLNKRMSIQSYDSTKKGWRVIGHVTEATLKDVVFFVSQKGADRAIRQQTRNVHAWGQGILVPGQRTTSTLRLYYNVFQSKEFHVDDAQGQVIYRARWLEVRGNMPYLSSDALLHPKDAWADTPAPVQGNLLLFPQADGSGFAGKKAGLRRLSSSRPVCDRHASTVPWPAQPYLRPP